MVKRFFGIFLILLLPLFSIGADKSKKAYELIYQDVQLLRQQVLQLTKKIEQNTQDINSIKKQIGELLSLVRLFQTDQASFKEDQKRVPVQYQILLEKLESINQKLIIHSEDLTQIKRSSPPPELQGEEETAKNETAQAAPPEKEEEQGQAEEASQTLPVTHLSPQEVYNMAYSDYSKGNFQLSIDGFTIYREQFPKSPLADNSLYWIGECYFSQKMYEDAIDKFNELILRHPLGDKTPAAYLKKGISLIELGKKEEALSVFKLLIGKYPLEKETKIAQQKIREMLS